MRCRSWNFFHNILSSGLSPWSNLCFPPSCLFVSAYTEIAIIVICSVTLTKFLISRNVRFALSWSASSTSTFTTLRSASLSSLSVVVSSSEGIYLKACNKSSDLNHFAIMHTEEDIKCVNKMWRKKMSYRFRHLLKYCVRTSALHKVQHSRTSSASQLITRWQSGRGSRRCRWRLRRVALRNTWGAGPVNAAMFKLELKINRCCTFYNIARPE